MATAVTILAGLASIVGVVVQLLPRTQRYEQPTILVEKTIPIKELERMYYWDTIRECERLELDKVAGFDTGISRVTLQEHVAEAPDWWREVFLLAVSRFSEPMDTAKGMVENPLITGWEGQPDDQRNPWAPLLAELGDPRQGVCGIVVKTGIASPEIDWVEIPAGEFEMGSDDNDPEADKREKLAFRWNPGRSPTGSMPCFMEAGDYTNDRYWEATPEVLAWRNGANPDLDAFDFGGEERKKKL